MSDTASETLAVAHDLAKRGIIVQPASGRVPMAKGWQNAEQLSGPDVEAIWGVDSPPNLSVLTGGRSGVFVIDVDGDEGKASMSALNTKLGLLPPTYTVETPSGGFHLYFAQPAGVRIQTNVKRLAPAVDLRGDGGQVIGGGSVAKSKVTDDLAPYVVRNSGPIAEAPKAWMEAILATAVAPRAASSDVDHSPNYSSLSPETKRAAAEYTRHAVEGERGAMIASRDWPAGTSDDRGRGWEKIQADAALKIAELAKANWSPLTEEQGYRAFTGAAPTDSTWTANRVAEKWASQLRRATPRPMPANLGLRSDTWLTEEASQEIDPQIADAAPTKPTVVLNDTGHAIDWTRESVGQGPLAGIFLRDGALVHTPRVGEAGYIAPKRESDDDGPAQVRSVSREALHAKIDYTFDLRRKEHTDDGGVRLKRTTLPAVAARHAAADPASLPNVRPLEGVTHAPMLRPDGSVVSLPGYDAVTRMLYLPTGPVPTIPERPTAQDVIMARGLLDELTSGFPFASESHRANFLGALLTPPLRPMCPGPYKMLAINAPERGSGKTLLARIAVTLHGGVVRASFPSSDEEVRKEIGTILDTTTGAVVVFDNVSSTPNSPAFDSALTDPQFSVRRLGSNSSITARNDRLWCMTGNNLSLGGDLARRTLEVVIDARMPHPERRTNFQHPDLLAWVREERGRISAALVTLARAWVVAGRPVSPVTTTDSYGAWVQTVRGILAFAEIPGTFDATSTQRDGGTEEDAELAEFLEAIHRSRGLGSWSAADLLRHRLEPAMLAPTAVHADKWPSDLAAALERNASPVRTFGRWLAKRQGRWAGPFTVRQAGKDSANSALWRIETLEAADQ